VSTRSIDSLPPDLDRLAGERTSAQRLPYSFSECQTVIEAQGGYLWAEARPGIGAQITFALPLHAAYQPDADLSSLRRLVETRISESGREAKRILVSVEAPANRQALSNELIQAGFEVIEAPTGQEILGLARSQEPNLILLDLMARDPTAFDIAMVLKQDRRTANIPILFLTAQADQDGEIRMGAISFLVRRMGTGALMSTINAVLGSGISPTGRVLVVEPDHAVRDTLVMMIQGHGYRVTEARSAEEALVLAERVGPELVLVNAAVAQERDYWLLRGLRQISDSMGIFVLADVMTEAQGRAAMNRGASGFSETGRLPDLLSRVRNGQSDDE
jgi:CheY-like chemotaxis protein